MTCDFRCFRWCNVLLFCLSIPDVIQLIIALLTLFGDYELSTKQHYLLITIAIFLSSAIVSRLWMSYEYSQHQECSKWYKWLLMYHVCMSQCFQIIYYCSFGSLKILHDHSYYLCIILSVWSLMTVVIELKGKCTRRRTIYPEIVIHSTEVRQPTQLISLTNTTNTMFACSICLVEAQGASVQGDFVQTVCAHQFHRECIEKWLSIKRNCPTCRREL
jgi:hypothetical protein